MSESTQSYTFEIPRQQQSIIKVIGIGGGGSNAVNHMFLQGIKGVEFVVCNTDLQALDNSTIACKLQIGTHLTEGLGCGANPEVGKAAAMESKEHIREMFADTKMIFITAGMGGGTGTGAAPVLARIARDMGILTVGIVTMPFVFEGRKKRAQAEAGIKELRANCDTVLVILNEKLREVYGNLPIGQAFAEADNVLTTAAKGIAEIITLAGYVNVDFQDVRTVMHNAGGAVMGSAETHGENRAIEAARQALASPLLDNCDIMGAKRILLSIVSGEEAELQMDEFTQITEYIQQQAGEEAEMIFGHGVDSTTGNSIRVTIIATDFAGKNNARTATKNTPEVHCIDDMHAHNTHSEDNSVNQNDPEITLKTERRVKYDPQVETTMGDPDYSGTEHTANQKEFMHETGADNPNYEFVFTNNEVEKTKSPSMSDMEGGTMDQDEMLSMEPHTEPIKTDDDLHDEVKTRLQKQATERREAIKANKKNTLTKEELDEKWSLPAYLRRGVMLTNTPHSSEPYVSRYNLNEDNNLLGNNKFLHDNVD